MRQFNQKSSALRNSRLYFQLGLIVSLFLCYFFLEYQSPESEIIIEEWDSGTEVTDFSFEEPVRIERKQIDQSYQQETAVLANVALSFIDDYKIVSDHEPDLNIAQNINFMDEELDFDSIFSDLPKTTEARLPYDVDALDSKPTFEKCKNLSKAEQQVCFNEQMKKFLTQNLRYPDRLASARKTGSVVVEFIISSDGTIKDIKTQTKSIHPDFDKEAMRVVSKLPKMIPGKSKGKSVDVRFKIPITFQQIEY
uniref:energy transducer TonB n=2 Tax=Flavobacterium sp. TaxID=239 RepID=UPI004048F3BC